MPKRRREASMYGCVVVFSVSVQLQRSGDIDNLAAVLRYSLMAVMDVTAARCGRHNNTGGQIVLDLLRTSARPAPYWCVWSVPYWRALLTRPAQIVSIRLTSSPAVTSTPASSQQPVPSTQCPVPTTMYPVPSTHYHVPSTQYIVPSTQYPVPSTQYTSTQFTSTTVHRPHYKVL